MSEKARKIKESPDKPLSDRQKAFCKAYIEEPVIYKAVIKAGYSSAGASGTGKRLLSDPRVIAEIDRLKEVIDNGELASAQEVMTYLTKVMRGEIKDQFGLEASLAERTKAAQELAKRTIDWEAKKSGQADSKIEIVLDWKR